MNSPADSKLTAPVFRDTGHAYVRKDSPSDTQKPDMVNHPPHYKDRVPGIECIDVTKHFDFCRGNAIKYLWRAGLKGGSVQTIEDLEKAIWYIRQEIKGLE